MSTKPRIVEVLSSDAPTLEAPLTVTPQYDNSFAAYWAPGYCGCGECRMIVGRGDTEVEAEEDWREQWREKYEPADPM